MPSARSYFNPTLYRKHLTRFWPIWAAYFLIWFFVLPVNLILNSGVGGVTDQNYARLFADRTVLDLFPNFGLLMAVFFSLITAMSVWSYLYNNRSTGLMHALPIRREGLYLTGFAAGVTFFVVPNAVIFLLTLGLEAMAGAVNVGALALWLAVQTMLGLFFFCFATLCGFITGHILGLPAFFFIFNFLAIGLLALVENTLHNFVYGFDQLTAAWPVAEGLSPLYCLVNRLETSYIRVDGIVTDVQLHGVPTLIAYTAAGLIMALAALLLYRHHHAEQAGEVVTASWLRPVFKYGVAFCGAISFGTLLYEIFSNVLRYSAWGMLGFVLLSGFLSYLAAEMLLQKSFRVLKKSWKGSVVFLGVLVVLTAAIELDFTGYEKRVPDAGDVERMELSDVYTAPYDSARGNIIDTGDPALITRLVSLHASAAANKSAVEAELGRYYREDNYQAVSNGFSIETRDTVRFKLTYTLRSGRTMSRSYTIPATAQLLDDPTSPAALLEDVLNRRDDRGGDYFPDTLTPADFISGSVSFYNFSSNGVYQKTAGGTYDATMEYGPDAVMDSIQQGVQLTAEQAGILFQAALKDLNAGALGRRYLLRDMDYYTQVYQNEISLTFYGIFPGWTEDDKADTVTVTFCPQTDSVNLISALRQLGIVDDDHRLTTQKDYIMAENQIYGG